jgi:hypothetical protein
MARINTEELLKRIGNEDFKRVKLKGLQGGTFYMLLECEDGTFVHENLDGSIKDYPQVTNALAWLKRKTKLKEIIVDIELWHTDR